MGLFPEIGRAWLTIDSDIYVSVKFNPISFPSHPLIFRLLDLDLRRRTRRRLLRWTKPRDSKRRPGGAQAGCIRKRRKAFAGHNHPHGNRRPGRHFRRLHEDRLFAQQILAELDALRRDAADEQADLCLKHRQRIHRFN